MGPKQKFLSKDRDEALRAVAEWLYARLDKLRRQNDNSWLWMEENIRAERQLEESIEAVRELLDMIERSVCRRS